MENQAFYNQAASLQAVPSSGLDTLRQRLVEIDRRAGEILTRVRTLADTAFGPIPESGSAGSPVSGPSLGGAVEDLAHTINCIEDALTRL